MDDSRFDTLTRALAAGTSRRTVLRRLTGGLLVGAASLIGGRTALADHTPDHCAPAGAKHQLDKNRPKSCCPGLAPDATGRCVASSIEVIEGALDSTDPRLNGGCLDSFRYDAYTFVHGGGPLSLAVRGADSRGGTLPDPWVILYAGVPTDFCGELAFDEDGGCGFDAYLEITVDPGTYTAVVIENQSLLGTYTFERNTFSGGGC